MLKNETQLPSRIVCRNSLKSLCRLFEIIISKITYALAIISVEYLLCSFTPRISHESISLKLNILSTPSSEPLNYSNNSLNIKNIKQSN